MEHFLFGSPSDPGEKETDQQDDETFTFDPNEESLTEGGEYADDSLRMVEQPYEGK
jgi:hypothetical protein